MRYIDRTAFPLPTSLGSAALNDRRAEYAQFYSLPEKERAQTRPPESTIGKDIYEDVMPPLIDLFHGKCAFCEQKQVSVNPYHFRPPAYASGNGDGIGGDVLHYGWLAYAWQNLYLICDDCMPVQPSYFPTHTDRVDPPTVDLVQNYTKRGDGNWEEHIGEVTMLLDPCRFHRFTDHFEVQPNGVLGAISAQAETTILHFRLNREDLCKRRAEALEAFRESGAETPSEDQEFTAYLQAALSSPDTTGAAPPGDAAFDASALASSPVPRKRASRRRKKAVAAPFYDLPTIEVKNYRGLENVNLTLPPRPDGNLARAILILGENATGKSSLLEAIALTLLNDKARDLLDEKAHKLLLNPKYMGSTAQRKSLATVKLGLIGPKGEPQERKLTVSSAGGMQGDDGGGDDTYPVFAYGAYRHYRDPVRRWRADRGVRNLFRSDDLLSNPQRWLADLNSDQRQLVIMALRIIIGGGFSTIDVEEDECFVVIRDKPQTDDSPSTEDGDIISRAPLDTLSSGFRTILALSCDMMRWLMARDGFTAFEHAQGLCLIDEVEAHLHPRWKVSIMTGLRRAFPAMTFIVTTHDPLCIRGMKNGEVMVLQRLPTTGAKSDLPVYVDALTTLPDVTQLTVEQLLSSDLFDLFDTTETSTGHEIAKLVDILARWRKDQPLTQAAEREMLSKFQSEIMQSLPVGATEVARLVEEAVADFLIKRRTEPPEGRKTLRDHTKAKIIAALGGL